MIYETCIAVFVFNRPDHAFKTLQSVFSCEKVKSTEIRIFCDGPRDEKDLKNIQNVSRVVDEFSHFENVTVYKREENWGLAKSIISGVGECFEDYESIIVLEDDMVVTVDFIVCMTEALKKYKNESKVWHISGWSYPISNRTGFSVYMWGVMNCWGWATWKDRWEYYEKDPGRLKKEWNWYKKLKFDLWGTHRFWKQIEDNYYGRKSTWAVFWYATIFEKKGLCINFCPSLVNNIGLDNSGENCGDYNPYSTSTERIKQDSKFPKFIESNREMILKCMFFKVISLIKKYFKINK